jgi:hypothetical protein
MKSPCPLPHRPLGQKMVDKLSIKVVVLNHLMDLSLWFWIWFPTAASLTIILVQYRENQK